MWKKLIIFTTEKILITRSWEGKRWITFTVVSVFEQFYILFKKNFNFKGYSILRLYLTVSHSISAVRVRSVNYETLMSLSTKIYIKILWIINWQERKGTKSCKLWANGIVCCRLCNMILIYAFCTWVKVYKYYFFW